MAAIAEKGYCITTLLEVHKFQNERGIGESVSPTKSQTSMRTNSGFSKLSIHDLSEYAIARSSVMRFEMGGCVAKMSEKKPSLRFAFLPRGSTMQRCAEPCLIALVGSDADSIFSSASARARGFRVSSAPDASARYSRCLDTAIASS
jgi:hypothetical protein